MFIDDMTEVLEFSKYHMYADDLQILFYIYCNSVYFALDSYSLRKLTVAFYACVRYVYRRRLFDHISDVSDSILGCSLFTYYITKSIILCGYFIAFGLSIKCKI
jgi:hypothetical protein